MPLVICFPSSYILLQCTMAWRIPPLFRTIVPSKRRPEEEERRKRDKRERGHLVKLLLGEKRPCFGSAVTYWHLSARSGGRLFDLMVMIRAIPFALLVRALPFFLSPPPFLARLSSSSSAAAVRRPFKKSPGFSQLYAISSPPTDVDFPGNRSN